MKSMLGVLLLFVVAIVSLPLMLIAVSKAVIAYKEFFSKKIA